MSSAFTAYRPAAIRAQLTPTSNSLLRQLTLLHLVDSTSLVLQRLPAEEQHGHAVVADGQYAGRGRRGRSWYSPPGQNIYLSLGWNFQRAAAALTQLPLAIAVTVARALQRAGVLHPVSSGQMISRSKAASWAASWWSCAIRDQSRRWR